MPEGPEVETIRRSLEPLLVGRRLGRPWVSRKGLRAPTSSSKLKPLEGHTVTRLGRHGKLMWIDVDDGQGLLVRLGMTGRLVVEPASKKALLHTHVRVPLDDGNELRYVDARRFGEVVRFATAAERDEERARMGPDALALDDEGREKARARLMSTQRSLKDALLDQTVLAGVGNIYAAEALFVARLSPFLRGTDLDESRADRLLDAVSRVLAEAVVRRGTSFSDYVDGTGERGENLAHVFVFQREGEPCRACGTAVVREVQGQRSTFYCRRCQR
jgi:formamidopyrimidine-DNA glycosylase